MFYHIRFPYNEKRLCSSKIPYPKNNFFNIVKTDYSNKYNKIQNLLCIDILLIYISYVYEVVIVAIIVK